MFLRVVAALLSLSRFDELVQRDTRARRRRALAGAATAAVVVIAIAFGGVATASLVRQQNVSRSEALAALAGEASREGHYDSAARFALAGFSGADWPLLGFEPWAAEAQLRNAEAILAALAALPGQSGHITAVAFSPDKRSFATAAGDTAQLWDAASGTPVGAPLESDGPVYFLTFSPDARRLATASADATTRLWDTGTGRQVAILLGATGAVTMIAFSPDGARLASASEDSTARLWDVPTGRLLTVLKHDHAVSDIVFSPDGSRLATASGDSARCSGMQRLDRRSVVRFGTQVV